MTLSYVVPSSPADRLPREGETIFARATKPDYTIDHETGCWVWQKFTTSRGYASHHAHRLYWARANGPIPPGFDIHHVCRNPSCVNPVHLEAVDPSSHRGDHQREQKRILTFEDAREIRSLGQDPSNSATVLAERYGVSRRHIADIWAGLRFVEPGVEPVQWSRICPQCGVTFTSKKRSAKYCTVICRSRYNRAQNGVKLDPSRWTA